MTLSAQAWSGITVTDRTPKGHTAGTKHARVPSAFKVAAVASLAGLRDSRGDVPLDLFVPVSTGATAPAALPEPAFRVLDNVDGLSTLREIAVKANLSLEGTIEAYLDLLASGVVASASEAGARRMATAASETFPPEEEDTGVSDLVSELAQLSDRTSFPRLRGAVEWNDLTAHEAWIVSLVLSGFSVQAILEVSPLHEDDTLSLLHRLIDARVIALSASA